MRETRLRSLITELGGELRGEDVRITGLAIDGRCVGPGELFIALPGERVDGHAFVAQAAEAGAAAALVSRCVDHPLPQWRVDDPRRLMIELACRCRSQSPARVIGVTGSNGKTTVKEMLAAIMGRVGRTLATEGNRNNELGVPLTLSRLDPAHRYAVIEMGCGHPGDIGLLASWARPVVGLVNNAGPAHLSGFGSVEAVARCKGELFEALPEAGTAVINVDDPHAARWEQQAAHCHVLRFGLESAKADIHGRPLGDGGLQIALPDQTIELQLPLPGRHNLANAVAAAASAHAAGADPEAIATGLAAVKPVAGRLQRRPGRSGSTLLDDSYNANPASLTAALSVLIAMPGAAWVVLGDMAELGDEAAAMHRDAGEQARRMGVERLFCVGPYAAASAEAFGAGAEHFAEVDSLIAAVQGQLERGVNLLIKGSRAAGMDRVAAALAAGEARRDATCC